MAEHFTKELAAEQKRPHLALSEEARALISGYSWPGNIRELRNAIERAVVLCEDREIGPGDLPPELLSAAPAVPKGGFHDQVEEFRKKILRDALAACNQNQTRAAELLGLQRTYLARLIRQYGLNAEG
jgi:Nif-specific regulatory protein